MEFNIGYFEGCTTVEVHGLEVADQFAEFLFNLKAPGQYAAGFNRAVLDMAYQSFQ